MSAHKLQIANYMCYGFSFLDRSDDESIANDLLIGKYLFRNIEIDDEEWETPKNLNKSLLSSWYFIFHSLSALDPLRRCYINSKDEKYLKMYETYIFKWIDKFGELPSKLPSTKEPGDYSWYDMGTSFRVYSLLGCYSISSYKQKIEKNLKTHLKVLLNESYYAKIGNHALHQNNALLSLALFFKNRKALAIALKRIKELRQVSIDDEGVSLEGAPSYHLLNMYWWEETKYRIDIAKQFFTKIQPIQTPSMHSFLKYSISTDGKFIPLGDTVVSESTEKTAIFDKFGETFYNYLTEDQELLYVLTQGKEGVPPKKTLKVFNDGFLFSKTFKKEQFHTNTHASLKFGYGLKDRIHAHDDAGAITYYVGDNRFLEDSGLYAYYGGEYRTYIQSSQAHNVMCFNDKKYYRSAISTLEQDFSGENINGAKINIKSIQDTIWNRTFLHNTNNTNFLCIMDTVNSNSNEMYQNWNIGDDYELIHKDKQKLVFEKNNSLLMCHFFGDIENINIYKGANDPIMGWRSVKEGEIHPSYNIQVVPKGNKATLFALFFPIDSKENIHNPIINKIQRGTKNAKINFTINNNKHLLFFDYSLENVDLNITNESKIKIIVLGNCQASPIRRILSFLATKGSMSEIEFIEPKPIYLCDDKDLEEIELQLSEVDVIITQPLSDKFKVLALSELQKKYSEKLITVPVVFFTGEKPEQFYFKNFNGKHLKDFIIDYHDIVIFLAYTEGYSIDFTSSLMGEKDLFNKKLVKKISTNSIKELQKRETNLDVTISDYITLTTKEKFFSINHPKIEVMEELVKRIVLKIDRLNIKSFPPFKTEILTEVMSPSYIVDIQNQEKDYIIRDKHYSRLEMTKMYYEYYNSLDKALLEFNMNTLKQNKTIELFINDLKATFKNLSVYNND